MRLSHALGLSLAMHLTMVWLFSTGQVYPDRIGQRDSRNTVPAFSVRIPMRHATLENDQNDNRSLSAEPLPQPAKDRYFASSEVEQRAEPVDIKPLIIPERAYMERRKGKVRLRAYIDEAGKVRQVDILAAEPPGVYEQAAIEAVTSSVFMPARNAGHPVKTFKELEINIDPYESIRIP